MPERKRVLKKYSLSRVTDTVIALFFVAWITISGFGTLKNYYHTAIFGVTVTSDGFAKENNFETNFNALFFNKMAYISLNGLISRMINQPVLNATVKLNNGYLAFPIPKADEDSLRRNAGRISELDQYLRENHIKFLYVQPPYKISKYNPELPQGVTDFSNENMDLFLRYLDEFGVNYIDLRAEMYQDGINQYDYFFKTDHHWKPECGFYVYNKLADYVNGELSAEVDQKIRSLDQYYLDSYPRWHLGSNGQRVGRYYAGIDDFCLIHPKFDTLIEREANSVTGTYLDTLIDTSFLEETNYSQRYVYDKTYDSIGSKFFNPNAANDKKIMIVSDSMGRVVDPFFILSYWQVYTMGLGELSKDVLDHYRPDMVIFMLYPDNISNESYFDFGILSRRYTLGDAIHFASEKRNADRFVLKGLSSNENRYAWTDGNELSMTFLIDGYQRYREVKGTINIRGTYHGRQRVIVEIQDKIVKNTYLENETALEFVFETPQDGVAAINIHLPDAISPQLLGESEDARKLSLQLIDAVFTGGE